MAIIVAASITGVVTLLVALLGVALRRDLHGDDGLIVAVRDLAGKVDGVVEWTRKHETDHRIDAGIREQAQANQVRALTETVRDLGKSLGGNNT